MSGYRNSLPQLHGDLFLTDGGLETTLIFLEGLELPEFAAFDLLKRPGGEAALLKYFRTYADIATRFGTGMILESATWRANADWGTRIGYDTPALDRANHRAVAMLSELRNQLGIAPRPMVISGCVGPRGDGYQPGHTMTATDAAAYHRRQIDVFADSDADMVSAITMNYVDEAIGIAMAAENAGMPVVISFTVETDGRLPTGQTLGDAIEAVEAATSGYPAYYMINCAHPTHFAPALSADASWTRRVRGLRANASRMSHVELNEAPELDSGDPEEFGREHAELCITLPQVNVLGGCCGTDHRHVEQIATACRPLLDRGTQAR